jgi:hypothetical protein
MCRQCGGLSHLRRDCRKEYTQKDFQEGGQSRTKERVQDSKRKAPVPSFPPSRCTLDVSTRKCDNSLNAEEWIEDIPCIVIIENGASGTKTKPDITPGLPKRELTKPYFLQMSAGKTLPVW